MRARELIQGSSDLPSLHGVGEGPTFLNVPDALRQDPYTVLERVRLDQRAQPVERAVTLVWSSKPTLSNDGRPASLIFTITRQTVGTRRLKWLSPEGVCGKPAQLTPVAQVGLREVERVQLDFDRVEISEARSALGQRGKRVEASGRSTEKGAEGIEKTVTIEDYDDFPNRICG